MRGTVLYGPRDVRFEEREDPKIIEPTDAIIRMAATCVCGSDLWPYRGIEEFGRPQPMGHEYCGIVEGVGSAVRNIRPGQFVVGSFVISDNTCEICGAGYQSHRAHGEFVSQTIGTQAQGSVSYSSSGSSTSALGWSARHPVTRKRRPPAPPAPTRSPTTAAATRPSTNRCP